MASYLVDAVAYCCNYIESLSGIETYSSRDVLPFLLLRCNYIESLSGIETEGRIQFGFFVPGCNYIESLSGIETTRLTRLKPTTKASCNYIESLSGIETGEGELFRHLCRKVATI